MREYINGRGNRTVSLYHESSGKTCEVCCVQQHLGKAMAAECYGCLLDHPSQVQHQCIMLEGEDRIGHGGVDRNEQRILASTPCQHHWCPSKVCCWYGMASTTLEKWWLERTIGVCFNDCRINRMPCRHFLFVLHNDTALCCKSNLMSNADISHMFSGLITLTDVSEHAIRLDPDWLDSNWPMVQVFPSIKW